MVEFIGAAGHQGAVETFCRAPAHSAALFVKAKGSEACGHRPKVAVPPEIMGAVLSNEVVERPPTEAVLIVSFFYW